MRLLKLAAYFSLGYLAYQFYLGMSQQGNQSSGGGSGGGERQSSGSRDLHRALNRDPGRMNVSGPGQGMTETAEDSQGGRSNHIVGRGVVRS